MIIKDYIHVANVKCQGCVDTISNELVRMEGVEHVVVNRQLGTVDLEYEEGMRPAVLAKLRQLGYPEIQDHDLLVKQER